MFLSENSNQNSIIGFAPGNPFARPAQISLIVAIVLIVICLFEALFAPTLDRRYAGGTAFLFVAGLSPLVVGMLILYSRRAARSIKLREGDYWVKWVYHQSIQDRLSAETPDEIYISPTAMYRTDQPLKYSEFSGGIEWIEIVTQGPPALRLVYHHVQNQRRYRTPQEVFVPIPPGYQSEAEKLVERFHREGLRKASPALFDLWVGVLGMVGIIAVACIVSLLLLMPLDMQRRDEEFAQYSATSAAIQATEMYLINLDFPHIQQTILNQTEKLRPQGSGQISAEEAGFAPDDNVLQVEFGYCGRDEAFYVLVVLQRPLLDTPLQDLGAYLYTNAANPYVCSGVWEVVSRDKVEEDWYYLSLSSHRATLVPYLTENAAFFNEMLTGTPPPTP